MRVHDGVYNGDWWGTDNKTGDVFSDSYGAGLISSVIFIGNCGNSEVRLYDDTNYSSTPVHIRAADGDRFDLTSTNWDNRTLSWTVYFANGPPTPTPPGTPVPVANCEMRVHDGVFDGDWWGRKWSESPTGGYSASGGAGRISSVVFGGNCGNSAILLYETPDDQSVPRVVRAGDGTHHDLVPTDWNDRTQFWTVYFSSAAGTPSQVPDVVGNTTTQGVGVLQAAWYTATRADIVDTTDPNLGGTIHSTTPAAGATLAPGGTVYYVEYNYTAPPAIATFQLKQGAATDIGAGGQSYGVWMIGTNPVGNENDIAYWNGSGWTPVPGGAVRIDVGPDGNPWVVQSTGVIFRYNGASFELMPGLPSDIGIGEDGSVWIIGTNPIGNEYDISYWNGSGWTAVPGGAVRIDVGPDGNPWIVQSTGVIFEYVNGTWEMRPGLASDISIGGNGDVWIVGTNAVAGGPYDIYRWNGTSWDIVPGGAAAIAVDVLGQPWVIQEGGQIWWGSLNRRAAQGPPAAPNTRPDTARPSGPRVPSLSGHPTPTWPGTGCSLSAAFHSALISPTHTDINRRDSGCHDPAACSTDDVTADFKFMPGIACRSA